MNYRKLQHVTYMSHMFCGSLTFNRNVSEWDVSNVTDMHRMFYNTSSLNRNVSGWDVS